MSFSLTAASSSPTGAVKADGVRQQLPLALATSGCRAGLGSGPGPGSNLEQFLLLLWSLRLIKGNLFDSSRKSERNNKYAGGLFGSEFHNSVIKCRHRNPVSKATVIFPYQLCHSRLTEQLKYHSNISNVKSKTGTGLGKGLPRIGKTHMSLNTLQKYDLGWDDPPVATLGLYLPVYLHLRPLPQGLLL